MARVWSKWLADFRDAQAPSGEVPEIAPSTPLYGYENTPGWKLLWGPTPAWDAATFILPQEMYEQYGDTRILAQMYETQRRLVDYTATFITAPDYSYRRGLGEYRATGWDGGSDATSSAYFYLMADTLARNAAILGHGADATKYRALADAVRGAYNRKYWGAGARIYRTLGADGKADPYAETQNVLPMAFGMTPAGGEASVAQHIAQDIAARGGHLGTGVFATRYVLRLLSDHGYGDVAYRAATQTTEPSWGWWIENGLSTMLEGWGLDSRSYDHHYFASISAWFYDSLAGIQPIQPGYGRIRIRPTLPDGLDHAAGLIATVRGTVGSSWTRTAGGFTQDVVIPGDALAEIWVPCGDGEVGAPANAGAGRPDGGYRVFSVGPGAYAFACRTRKPAP
jgi:alpha-L-rhamnosidase